MGFAVIIEKYPGGNVKTERSDPFPPTPQLDAKAKTLDAYLSKRIPEIEQELINSKLLDERIPLSERQKSGGNVLLWHALGQRLRAICEEQGLTDRSLRERRWLWEAIANIHASERIKRARRGRARNHFEYCYRLSKFPIEFAKQINWSEWVYFLDSRTVREEQRADEWLTVLVKRHEPINRRMFRAFTQNLNKRIQNLDTSVLTKDELFGIYDKVWQETKTGFS
jgi:hypothetical protein